MKTTQPILNFKHLITLFVFTLIQTVLLAQEGGTTETNSTSSSTKVTISEETTGDWYTQPWVWVVGAAVFVLLLIALLRSGGGDRTATHTDKVTYKETVVRDRGTDTDAV